MLKRRLFKLLGIILLPFLLLFISYYAVSGEGLSSISSLLEQHVIALSLWRYALFAGLWFYWPVFIRHYAKNHQRTAAWSHAMQRLRITFALFFMVMELLVAHNGFGYILGHLLN